MNRIFGRQRLGGRASQKKKRGREDKNAWLRVWDNRAYQLGWGTESTWQEQ